MSIWALGAGVVNDLHDVNTAICVRTLNLEYPSSHFSVFSPGFILVHLFNRPSSIPTLIFLSVSIATFIPIIIDWQRTSFTQERITTFITSTELAKS